MINTDKYKRHTKGDNEVGWRIVGDNFVMNGESPSFRYIAYVQVNNDGENTIVGFSDADANLIADTPLLLAEVEQLREEKEAMLKHITDLEVALKKAVEMWDEETPLFDFELMITGIKEQFAYLFDIDDGYEPPEHMTADDFNEMHSGPYQPDDTGYMDGDY